MRRLVSGNSHIRLVKDPIGETSGDADCTQSSRTTEQRTGAALRD